MTRQVTWGAVGAWLVFAIGCSDGGTGTASGTTGGVNGISFTGGSGPGTSGGATGTTGAGVNTTTSTNSTSGSSSGGVTGQATTNGGSTGVATTGGGTTTGGTTSDQTSSSSGTTGTTGYVSGPPYMGFDAGPISEPPIASGCTAATPFLNPDPGGYPRCVSCRTSTDCPADLFCNTTPDNNGQKAYQCAACRTPADCNAGQICQFACRYQQVAPYYVCTNGCQQDCRTADPNQCNPGMCDTDAGGCIPNWCTENANCVVDGHGACNFGKAVTFPPNGIGQCDACTTDGGGCSPDQACVRSNQTGNNICQTNCQIDPSVCSGGTSCAADGTCADGCQSAADCVGSFNGNSGGSICHQGQCVSCLKSADCPDYRAGCNPQYPNGTPVCGYCTSDQDCQSGGSGQHCEPNRQDPGYYTNQCGCHSDNECPLDAPVCVGLDTSAGFPQGSGHCGCTDTSQCGEFLVCETRYPFGFSFYSSNQNTSGGACIPGCQLVGGTDCASAGIGPSPNTYYPSGTPPRDNVCNPSTGYCVPCSGDIDCHVDSSNPLVTPACVLYGNGTDPGSGQPTGGGQCGCSDTTQCNDSYACWNPGLTGTCKPACTVSNGQDSCNPYREYSSYPAPTSPFCNSWTGACVQCLDNYGCTNIMANYIGGLYVYPSLPAPNCNSAGQCVGCSSDADCPSSSPNCTDGFCGFCTSNANCYGDAGFTCMQFNGPYNGGTCMLTGCVADSNEIATSGGTICPSERPYCPEVETCYYNCTYTNICAACRPDYNAPNYQYYGDCNNSLPPGYYYGQCQQNGTCYYYGY